MLGASYLLDLSLQHFILLGLALVFWSELMMSVQDSNQTKYYFEQLGVTGISIINLSFLYFAYSEDLLITQVLLSFVILVLFFFKLPKKQGAATSRQNEVYFILLVFLFIELIN